MSWWRALSSRRRAAGPVAGVITLLLVVLAVVIYYVIPVPGRMHEASWELLFSLGVVVLAVLIIVAIIKLLGRGEGARMRALVVLLTVTVLFFSWADRSVANLPGQFTQLHTKTDALYFNVSTLATVGFGDVHPTGQLARSAVTIQIIFNLVFLGAALTVITGMARAGARKRLHQPEQDAPPEV